MQNKELIPKPNHAICHFMQKAKKTGFWNLSPHTIQEIWANAHETRESL